MVTEEGLKKEKNAKEKELLCNVEILLEEWDPTAVTVALEAALHRKAAVHALEGNVNEADECRLAAQRLRGFDERFENIS